MYNTPNQYFTNLDYHQISKEDVLRHKKLSDNEFTIKLLGISLLFTTSVLLPIAFLVYYVTNHSPHIHTLVKMLVLVGGVFLAYWFWIFINKTNQYLMKVNDHNTALNQTIYAQLLHNQYKHMGLNCENKKLIDEMSNYIIRYEGILHSTRKLSLNDLELYLTKTYTPNITSNHSNETYNYKKLETNLTDLYAILDNVEDKIRYKINKHLI